MGASTVIFKTATWAAKGRQKPRTKERIIFLTLG
jgi:hypothetical protein